MKSKSINFFILTLFLISALLFCFQNFSQRQETNLIITNSKNNDLNTITDDKKLDFELKTSVKEDWHQYWRLTKLSESRPEKILIDSLDNIYFLGNTYQTGGKFILNIIKYNSKGEYQWNKTWGDGRGYCYDAAFDSSLENIFIAGYTRDLSGDYNFLLAKFDKNGNYQWNRTWGTSFGDWGYGIALDLMNNIYIVGTSYENVYPYATNITIVKFLFKLDRILLRKQLLALQTQFLHLQS